MKPSIPKTSAGRAQWIELLIHVAAAYFRIPALEVFSGTRKKNAESMVARKCIFRFLQECGMDSEAIGRAFGKSRSTAHTGARWAFLYHVDDHPVLMSRLAAVPRK